MAKLLEVWCRIRDAAWACSLVFAGVLHELISWLYCSLCIAKEWCLSSALLYELLYRRVEPQKTLGEWYSCHLSDKNYRFSDNLPHSQALLEDQLSRITWRDIIFLFRGTVSLIYFGSLFCPTPRYAGEAPGYLSNDNFMSRIKSTKQVLRLPGIIFSLRSKSFLRWLASVTCGWTRRRERKYTAIPS